MKCVVTAGFSFVVVAVLAAAPGLALAQASGPRGGGGVAESGSGLGGKVERLEEQLTNLQGVVAAVETLAKSNSGGNSGYAAASGGVSGDQVRQLSEQIADLTQRIERLEAKMAGGPIASTTSIPRDQPQSASATPNGFEDKEPLPPLGGQQPASPPRNAARQSSFPQQAPAIETRPLAVPPRPAPGFPSAGATASATGPSKALFDQAYSALNRREYSAAETYFQQFLDQYPTDPQAGTAQFWLGEAAFVSGEYRSAADRFLKTFTTYPNNERAPEALLKLAISLRRLGENSAACDSFSELERRYPQAPKTVLQRADTEKKRAGCG